MYLLDTNILIYSGEPVYSAALFPYVTDPENVVSVISSIETLGYHKITTEQIQYFKSIFSIVVVLPIDEAVVGRAIQLANIIIFG